jgi:hypothetical protein
MVEVKKGLLTYHYLTDHVPLIEAIKDIGKRIPKKLFIVKEPVVCATVSNINANYRYDPDNKKWVLEGVDNGTLPAIDGVVLSVNDRVLIKDQNNKYQNGVYVVVSLGDDNNKFKLVRSDDLDEDTDFDGNIIIPVKKGQVNSSKTFTIKTENVNLVQRTDIEFVELFLVPGGKVEVSETDKIAGYLYEKIIAGNNITITKQTNPDGSEQLVISGVEGVSGSGTQNYLTKWSESNVLTNSIIYDNGINVGIGVTNPIYKLDVNGSVRVSGQTVFNNVAYTWPSTAGSSGQVLTTDGTGNLSWTTVSGGGGWNGNAESDLNMNNYNILNVTKISPSGNIVIASSDADLTGVTNSCNVILGFGSLGNNSDRSVSIGLFACNNRCYGIGIGAFALNNFCYGVGIGYNALDNSCYGVGIGYIAYNNYNYGIGIGYYAYNNYCYGVGIGYCAYNNYNYGIGIGARTCCNYNYGIGIGYNLYCNSNCGIGIGHSSNFNCDGGVGIGHAAYNNYCCGVGVGFSAANNRCLGVGIGAFARNNYNGGVGVGKEACDNHDYGIGIGYIARCNYNYGIGIGYNSYGNYDYGIGIGANAQSNCCYGIGIGYYANNNYCYGIGIGYVANNNYCYAIGIGACSSNNQPYSVAIGACTYAANSAVVLGYCARANNQNSIAIGCNAIANAQNSIAIGPGTVNNYSGTVSFGNYTVYTAGDFEVTDSSKGLILKSPNGTRFRIQVNDSGTLITTSI